MIVGCAFLTGCAATPYQPIGVSDAGGYSTTRLGKNRFYVIFAGNDYTTVPQVHDYAFLRAAEATQEYGYSWFSILSEGQGSPFRSSPVTLSFDNGFIPAPTVDNYAPARSLKYGIQIACFEKAPDTSEHQGKIYEAGEVIREMKEKYGLK